MSHNNSNLIVINSISICNYSLNVFFIIYLYVYLYKLEQRQRDSRDGVCGWQLQAVLWLSVVMTDELIKEHRAAHSALTIVFAFAFVS